MAASNFLADDAPILTLRPYSPEQLELYVGRLARALQTGTGSADPCRIAWRIPDTSRFAKVFSSYREQFAAEGSGPASHTRPKTLDVLGQPLLAHLAVRVMSECETESEVGELISSPTRLYRNLVDLTCGKAGKAAADTGDSPEQARIRGVELRRKLHRTAAAITAWGQESIPFGELVLRARLHDDLTYVTPEALQDRPWTRLMISFYFKGGGEHHGCEFLHKSFREYLFAEGIVEAIKERAIRQVGDVPIRQPQAYWQDFNEDDKDQRFGLSRDLGELLSPQWLTPEVNGHLDDLVAWEIRRSSGQPAPQHGGEPTDPLSIDQWETARDLLAELWAWWGEGVHLRPQPKRNKKTDGVDLDPPYALDLVDMAMQRERSRTRPLPVPLRTTTVDSHLGAALLRLNVLVHYRIARARGWDGSWQHKTKSGRDYQSVVPSGDSTVTLFATGGSAVLLFWNYSARINAAGWYHFGSHAALMGVDLEFCELSLCRFDLVDLRRANLRGSGAFNSLFWGANLSGADVSAGPDIPREFPRWIGAEVSHATLHGAILRGTNWAEVRELSREQLAHAIMDESTILPSNLQDMVPAKD